MRKVEAVNKDHLKKGETPSSTGELGTRGMKNWRFSTEIAVYLINGAS